MSVPPPVTPYMPASGQPGGQQQGYSGYPPQGGYPGYPPQGGAVYPQGYQQPEHKASENDGDDAFAPRGPPPPDDDPEVGAHNDEFAAEPFSDKAIRRRFIGKVYTILSVQLAFTAAIVALFIFVSPIRNWVRKNTWFYYCAYAVFFVTYLVLACCDKVRRKFPGNFIALGVFTLALSYMAGALSAMYTINSVLVCLLITVGVCVSVSVLAICCPCDITKCQAVIGFLSILLFIFGIAVMITYAVGGYNQTLHAVYGGVAAVIFCIYLGYDTQLIMGGRKYALSPEDYVYGAMQLYVDVVTIFMLFLSLFGIGDN